MTAATRSAYSTGMDIPHDFTDATDESLLDSLMATSQTPGKVKSHAAVLAEVLRRMRDGRERALSAACLRTTEGYGME